MLMRLMLWGAVLIFGIVSVNAWAANADAARLAEAKAYEVCVQAEYGMSPTLYFDRAGVWPEC